MLKMQIEPKLHNSHRKLSELEKQIVIGCVKLGSVKIIWTKATADGHVQLLQIKDKKYYCRFVNNKLVNMTGWEKPKCQV